MYRYVNAKWKCKCENKKGKEGKAPLRNNSGNLSSSTNPSLKWLAALASFDSCRPSLVESLHLTEWSSYQHNYTSHLPSPLHQLRLRLILFSFPSYLESGHHVPSSIEDRRPPGGRNLCQNRGTYPSIIPKGLVPSFNGPRYSQWPSPSIYKLNWVAALVADGGWELSVELQQLALLFSAYTLG